ncbi:LamG-like jellyroll fold domain-containing protein [Mariniradius saccharolyticus]|uniref:LamG-like jellyroll fold domain-containing protein n=1 Tax=Mariniradius saccharolyticus TaxID=1245591 RepID=UPI001B7FCD1C|nr:LamG-like jellyroll fold domain-containing protein [Mariniradius saccharolyticus]
MTIRDGNITIAGQTAPGDGITIQGYPLRVFDQNNVIIRYIRSRLGDQTGVEGDAFEIKRSKNLIIDHCSFSWGTDETCSLDEVEDATVQYCIIAEGLNEPIVHNKSSHSFGSLLGGKNLSFFGNLMAHFHIRTPSLTQGSGPNDLRNNVIYNWGFRSTNNGALSSNNLFYNYYKPGPATNANPSSEMVNQFFLWPTAIDADPTTYAKFFLEGNKIPGNSRISTDQWNGVRLENGSLTETYLNRLKNRDNNGNLVPFPVPNNLYSITRTADEAYSNVLAYVGANLFRDAVDQRIINETRNGTTTFRGSKTGLLGIIDSQNDVGGWPTLRSLAAPADTDQDGMPDTWETANNLNPNRSNDREYNLNPYYTDIEVYINSLVDNLVKSQYPSTPLTVNPILPAANASNIAPVDISFAWEMVPNADTYQVQISKSSTFGSGNITLSNVKELSLVYPQLDANSTYYWRVRAVRNGVIGPYSGTRSFQTNSLSAVPGRTLLLQPASNSVDIGLDPVFTWAKVPNTQSYQIQVSTLADFSSLVVNQSGLTENSFQSPKLLENQTYYWRIRARNANGTGSYSVVSSFKTVSLAVMAEEVVPIRPTNGVVINPVNIRLEWQPVSGAESYRVQVSTNSSFSNSAVFKDGVVNSFLDIPNLNSNTLYYWRVIAVNRAGMGEYPITPQTFKTGPFTEAPAQISLNSPAHDANIFSTSITFSWTASPIAKGYTFQLSTREDFSTFVQNVSGLTSSSRTVSNLQANTQYFWRVWASNEAGNSPISEIRKVRSATYSGTPSATTLVSPAINAVVGASNIQFTWQNQPNTQYYRIEISESTSFSTTVYRKNSIPGTSWIVPSLTVNKTYYWRVRTSNPAGTGSYSSVWKFSTNSGTVSLSQPNLVSPGNASMNQPTSLSVSWNPVTNATSYDVQVSESNTFSTIAFSQSGITATNTTFGSLLENKTYFWRVRAKSGTVVSSWSEIWNFGTNGSTENSTLTSGLVGHWSMEDGSGNRVLDVSGTSNHGTLQTTANVAWVEGKSGLALLLNGWSNRFAVIPHNQSLEIPNAVTISAWVKPNTLHRGTILSKSSGNGFEFWLDNNGQLEFRLNRSSNGSSYVLRSNFNYGNNLQAWIHLAATFDGSTMKIFVNGNEDKSASFNPFGIGTTSGNLVLGALGTIQRMNGELDEVMLHNRALSIEEIRQAMQGGLSIQTIPSQLAGHWKMDEGSGNMFRDDSGNANNANIINNSGVSWSEAKIGLGVNLNGFSERYGRVPHNSSLELSNALTIAAWVKPNALHRGTIASKSAGNGFELWLDIDGFIEFRLNRTNNGSTYRLRSNYNYSGDIGKWIHVTATFDGQTSKIFINGTESTSKTFSAPFEIGTNSGDLVIGALGTIQRMNGSLDDLRIYSDALSPNEVFNLANPNQQMMRLNGEISNKGTYINRNTESKPNENTPEFNISGQFDTSILLYPNPAEKTIYVKNLWVEEGIIKVLIFDTNSRNVKSLESIVQNNQIEMDIDQLGLSTGTYILILQDNFHREILRFIKK